MLTNFVLLQDGAGGAGTMNIIMIVALIAISYFFMVRPQQKKQKEIRKFREAISKGDRVITAGGIYGRVSDIRDTTFELEIDKGVKITVDKGSVYPSAADANTEDTKNKQ